MKHTTMANSMIPASILMILSFLAIVAASQDSRPDLQNFLQCLPRHSAPSSPVSEVTYTPRNSSFDSVLGAYINNRRFLSPETPKPLAIVTAKHVSHIQATVICARQHGLQIRSRSGGHDFEGLSYVSSVPFIVIDMFNLRAITVDTRSKSAWVEAGATLGEIYSSIANASKMLAFPAGVCPAVGAGGHFSGGGYGNLMRKYGLSVDNILDAKIVVANGQLLDRKTMGEDLFWAIRGGGGASFGVITAWKIMLVPVPKKVTVFMVNRTLEQGATDIAYKWQHVASKLPRELFIRVMPVVTDQGRTKTVIVRFICEFLGSADRLLRIVSQRLPELGLRRKDCIETSWINSTVLWAEFPVGTPTSVLLERPTAPSRAYFKGKSDYVKFPIPKDGLRDIWKAMTKIDGLWMQWNPYGGIMDEIPENATPFPHRSGNLFLAEYYTSWFDEDEKVASDFLRQMKELYAFMEPYVSRKPREAFLNYRDLDIGSNPSNASSVEEAAIYGAKYFKGNLKRLMTVKARYDPENFFKNEQSIPPAVSA